ncbi:MAG: response regulator [Terracidiphilus sp.]|jgi:DNA-binding NtrC family response regulator
MAEQILFVDDDKGVLDGIERLLHGEFSISKAQGAVQGLASIQLFGPYAIVVSDLRMPGMDGASFLERVHQQAPKTVTMLLTGYRDLDVAINAVNEGYIFRYLKKPCKKEDLVNAIHLGLAQYRTNMAKPGL